MLYSIFVGNHTDYKNTFRAETDEKFNYDYISCDSIKQRLRLWKHTPSTIKQIGEDGTCGGKVYKLADNTFFSNNFKNMSIMLMKSGKNKSIAKDTPIHAMYVTLFNVDYKLLRYNLVNDKDIIMQTYKKKGVYQGCMIGIVDDLEPGDIIMELDVIDNLNRGLFTRIVIEINPDGCPTLRKTTYPNKDKQLMILARKYKERTLSFKVTVPEGKIITNTFITTEDTANELDKLTLKFGLTESRVIGVSKHGLDYLNNFTDESKLSEDDLDTHNFIKHELIDSGVRAITLYKIKLPYNFCKTYKILYLFAIDEHGTVTCLRSN